MFTGYFWNFIRPNHWLVLILVSLWPDSDLSSSSYLFVTGSLQLWERGAMENITANEIAGYGVGALLLCATIAAPKLDAFIASSQRRSPLSLSLCLSLKLYFVGLIMT